MANNPWAEFQDAPPNDPWAEFQDAPHLQVQAQLPATKKVAPLQPHAGVVGLGETLLNLGTGMAATSAAGLAGLGNVVTNAYGLTDSNPADTINRIVAAGTYEPRTAAGQALTTAVTYPFVKYSEGADWVGGKVAEATGSPALGAAANTAIQALPMAIGPIKKGVQSMRATAPGANPGGASAAQEAARVWTSSNTSLDWSRLPAAFQEQLAAIAQNASNLRPADVATIERAGRLASLDIPATRGQLTRDPVQLRNEGNVSATTAGKPIRDIYVSQNKALIENLRVLKNAQGGTLTEPSHIGAAVQKAARDAMAVQEARVNRLYKAADNSPETLQLVDTTPVFDLIRKTPDVVQYGWVESWLKKNGLEPGDGVSIRDIESLRKAASARAADGGTPAFYAKQLIRTVDETTQGAGGRLYQAARAARKKLALEFEDQAGVARLVKNKSRTDPAVALEDTFNRTVIGGSKAELEGVQKTLLEGGTKKTRTAGQQAWSEMRSKAIDHIIERATRSVSTFEDGTPNLTADALKKGIDSISKENMDVLFGPGVYQHLQRILNAAKDVKTEPPPGFKGSPTVANALAFLENMVTKVPVAGDVTVGAARGAAQLRQMGATGRVLKSTASSPVEDLANRSRNAMSRNRTISNALSTAATSVGEQSRKK